ncbi:unnamed protein product [Heligmosomoides polygyrus]|uniref:Reverse transcriptase domain-containing protein n=1 Tax=Heligmosomoides polygyrus TaxID=6339 RepID=A0A183G7Y8_HELPZ|nr:unnamed protein product [Heligmosomoides polygyrus]
MYKRDIETAWDFRDRKITIVFTLNVDGGFFFILKHELNVLQREGIPIRTASDTWICTPKLVNGIIDFAEMGEQFSTSLIFPGWTQMMDFFTVNHCMPYALRLLSEAITTSVFKAVAVLAYWMLVRVLENAKEFTEADFPGVRNLGNSMKNLWYALGTTLITLKFHLNDLLEFARASHRSIAKTGAIAVKNSSQSLPGEHFFPPPAPLNTELEY